MSELTDRRYSAPTGVTSGVVMVTPEIAQSRCDGKLWRRVSAAPEVQSMCVDRPWNGYPEFFRPATEAETSEIPAELLDAAIDLPPEYSRRVPVAEY